MLHRHDAPYASHGSTRSDLHGTYLVNAPLNVNAEIFCGFRDGLQNFSCRCSGVRCSHLDARFQGTSGYSLISTKQEKTARFIDTDLRSHDCEAFKSCLSANPKPSLPCPRFSESRRVSRAQVWEKAQLCC